MRETLRTWPGDPPLVDECRSSCPDVRPDYFPGTIPERPGSRSVFEGMATASAFRAGAAEASGNGSHFIPRKVCRLLTSGGSCRRGRELQAGGATLDEVLGGERISRDLDVLHDSEDASAVRRRVSRLSSLRGGPARFLESASSASGRRSSKPGSSATRPRSWSSGPRSRQRLLGSSLSSSRLSSASQLHPFDLATNKVLALVGRLEVDGTGSTRFSAPRSSRALRLSRLAPPAARTPGSARRQSSSRRTLESATASRTVPRARTSIVTDRRLPASRNRGGRCFSEAGGSSPRFRPRKPAAASSRRRRICSRVTPDELPGLLERGEVLVPRRTRLPRRRLPATGRPLTAAIIENQDLTPSSSRGRRRRGRGSGRRPRRGRSGAGARVERRRSRRGPSARRASRGARAGSGSAR